MKPRSGRSLWRDSAYGALYGHLSANSGREIGPVLSAVSACAAAAVRLLTPTGWTGSGFHAPLACQILLLGELAMRGKSDFQMWSPPALPRRSRQRQVQMLAQRRAYFRPQKPPRAVRWCSRELRVCSRRSISPAPTGAANKGIETDTAGDGESQRWRRGVVASTAGMRAAEGRAPRHSPPVPPKRTCEVAPVDLAI